jgi:spermidine synthase
VRPFLAPVPTYAGGMLALVAAGGSRDALRPPCKVLRERYPTIRGGTRYYSPEIHRAAFTLAPSFAPRSGDEDRTLTACLETGS